MILTFPSPQPWLPCEQNLAAQGGVAGWGSRPRPRGAHGRSPMPAGHRLLPVNSLAASGVDKLKGRVNALRGCATASRCCGGSSRPPAPGRDGGELRALPAAGRAWQDLPVPACHGRTHPAGHGPSPAPRLQPAGPSWCGGKAAPASNEMISLRSAKQRFIQVFSTHSFYQIGIHLLNTNGLLYMTHLFTAFQYR